MSMSGEEQAAANRAEVRASTAVLQEQVRNLSLNVAAMAEEVRAMRKILDQQLGGMKVLRGLAYLLGGLGGAGLIGWLLGLLRGHS